MIATRRALLLAPLGLAVGARAAGAEPEPEPAFAPGGEGTVARVIDGQSLMLSDGRGLRLVDILAPDRALGRAAQAALQGMVMPGPLRWRFAGYPQDRHGRVIAQAFVGDLWVQGELLRRGLARVESQADERLGVVEMLTLEGQARAARLGLWANSFYAVRDAGDMHRFAGTFQIVAGTVAAATKSSGQVYIDFGPDWHTAFSLRLGPAALRLFRAARIDPMGWKDTRLQVRGFVDGTNHPTIAITHPEQVERL